MKHGNLTKIYLRDSTCEKEHADSAAEDQLEHSTV